MNGLTGKNVLITGASSGIGQAIAIRLAQEGCNIAINYRKNAEEAAETEDQAMQKACGQVENCGVKSLIVQGDVSREDEVIALINTVIDRFGSLDILINNAGIQTECPSHELSADEFDRVLDTNLRGAFLCARETIKHLLSRQQAGSIINISSVHEIIPRPTYLSYSISKGGMGNLTKTLALEYADRQIRVNAIAPGATVTPINQDWIENPDKKAVVESHIPMGRAGTSEEMGSEYFPKTAEGRILCLLLAIYAFAVFGYVTATLATFFIGQDADDDDGAELAGQKSLDALRDEIAALRTEIGRLDRDNFR